MAGFDVVIELSNARLLDLIKCNLQFGGERASPPFELLLPISADVPAYGAHVDGTADLIVTGVQLTLNADDTMTLSLTFDHSAAAMLLTVLGFPVPLTVSGLAGTMSVRVPISMPVSGRQGTLTFDFTNAITAFNLTPAAQARIAADLTGALNAIPVIAAQPATVAGLVAAVQPLIAQNGAEGLTAFAHQLGATTAPLRFQVSPGTNGALAPALRFESIEVHCIADPNPARQALVFFGTLLAARHGAGDHTQKAATAITAGHGFAVSISPEAFHSLVFCPSLAAALTADGDPANMPATCGAAMGVSNALTQGGTITRFADTFADGQIDIDGNLEKSGFCWSAHATFHLELTMSISGTSLLATPSAPDVHVDVDVPWYCYVLLGALTLGIGDIVLAVTQSSQASGARDQIRSLLGGSLGNLSQGLGGFSNARFDAVTVSAEGLTLEGDVTCVPPPAAAARSLAVRGSVVTLSTQQVSAGTFNGDWCVQGVFPYTEQTQRQSATFEAVPTMLGSLPTALEWWVTAVLGTNEVFFAAAHGNLALPGVDATYPFPLPGGTIVTQPVHLAYSKSQNIITLENDPADGEYAFELHARWTDSMGHVREAESLVLFAGDVVIIGGGYGAQMARSIRGCLAAAATDMHPIDRPWIDPWVPVDFPPPEELMAMFRSYGVLKSAAGQNLLAYAQLAHRGSVMRAYATSLWRAGNNDRFVAPAGGAEERDRR